MVTALRGLPLLDAAIAQIEAHPEAWRQDYYRCGSGMCVAGWTAELAGGQWVDADPDGDEGADMLRPEADDGPAWAGGPIHVHDRAQRLLGISERAAEELFQGDNDLADIKAIRYEIAAGLLPAAAPITEGDRA